MPVRFCDQCDRGFVVSKADTLLQGRCPRCGVKMRAGTTQEAVSFTRREGTRNDADEFSDRKFQLKMRYDHNAALFAVIYRKFKRINRPNK